MVVRGGISMHRWLSRDPSHLLDASLQELAGLKELR
jgi:hypothetical protein